MPRIPLQSIARTRKSAEARVAASVTLVSAASARARGFVEDNGPGVPEELRDRIFYRWFPAAKAQRAWPYDRADVRGAAQRHDRVEAFPVMTVFQRSSCRWNSTDPPARVEWEQSKACARMTTPPPEVSSETRLDRRRRPLDPVVLEKSVGTRRDRVQDLARLTVLQALQQASRSPGFRYPACPANPA